MARTILLLFSLIFISGNLNAQEISGYIQNEDGSPLSYMNVGIIGKGAGTVSNQEGFFSFEYDSKKNDTIRFSMIGYETIDYLLSDFKNESIITIGETTYELPDAVIEGSKFTKEKMLGNPLKSTAVVLSYENDSMLGREIAQLMKVKKASWLKEIHFYISSSAFDSIVFRLNVFDLNENDIPNKSLLPKNILHTFKQEKGIISIDLSAYNIVVEDDFVVSLECVNTYGIVEKDIKYSITFGGKLWGGDIYYKDTSQDNWKNFKSELPFIVNPGISFGALVKY